MENNFVIGEIVNTQGIKGEVRVIPHTDDITRFELLKSIFILRRGALEEREITSVRYHKQFVLLKLKGIDDMTTAEGYKGCEIQIPAEEALPCAENEYYVRDLYGMSVYTEDGELLGALSDVLFTGANDVYVIQPTNPTQKDILLPAIKQCILSVDVAEKKMVVKLLEGLVE
jgi:16S rRNA processing protein RimM